MGTVPSHPWIKLSCPKKYKKPVISFEITGFMELAAGLEPATCALRMRCSTN